MNLIGCFFIAILLSFLSFGLGQPYNYIGLILGVTIFLVGLVNNSYKLKEDEMSDYIERKTPI